MKRFGYAWLFSVAMAAVHADAATITLTVPDGRFEKAVEELCRLSACPSGTLQQRAHEAADAAINALSILLRVHFHSLSDLGATLEVTP